MVRIIVTRPEPDAGAFAELCRARGADAVVAPMMTMVFGDRPLSIGDARALAFTSANGVRAFEKRGAGFAGPVFAVGPATADAAARAGFADIRVAAGDVASLAALIIEAGVDGEAAHVSGAAAAGDLVGVLRSAGIKARRIEAYRMEPAPSLPPAARAALASPRSDDWVALFSPRTARIFAELVGAAGLGEKAARVGALCLSDAVASAAALDWRETRVAASPAGEALLDLVLPRA